MIAMEQIEAEVQLAGESLRELSTSPHLPLLKTLVWLRGHSCTTPVMSGTLRDALQSYIMWEVLRYTAQ